MKIHIIFKTFGGMDGNFLKRVSPKPKSHLLARPKVIQK
jgi:hypothetical protein